MPSTVVSGRRLVGVFFVAWLLVSSLAVLWAFATPIAAAPDEPAHLVKAASVVRGQLVGPETGPTGTLVQVPQYIAWTHAQTCTAMNDDVTADCLLAVPGDPAAIVDARTTAGLYNPLYYALVGWPTLVIGDSSGVYAMRVVSALITSAFLALSVVLVWSWRRRTLPLIGLGAAVTPMVLFLGGLINPNTLEIAATLSAFAAVLSIVTQPQPRMLGLRCTILAVSAVVAANMRGLSLLWLAVAVLVPLLLASRTQLGELLRGRGIRIAIVVSFVGVVAALAWIGLSGSLTTRSADDATSPDVPYLGSSPLAGFAIMMVRTGANIQQMIATFGWMDTTAPVEVYAVWVWYLGGLIGLALLLARGRAFVFVATLFAAFLLLPAIAQGVFITGGGYIWQGRYTLPLLVILLLGAAWALAPHFDALTLRTRRALVITAWSLWGAAQLFAFASTLRRYAVGAEGSWGDALAAPSWAPPGGTALLIVAFALVSAGIVVLAIRASRHDGGYGGNTADNESELTGSPRVAKQ